MDEETQQRLVVGGEYGVGFRDYLREKLRLQLRLDGWRWLLGVWVDSLINA